MAKPITKTPPKPPSLPAKEEAAHFIRSSAQQAQDDEQTEGDVIDQIRAHLSEVDDLLDQLEAEAE